MIIELLLTPLSSLFYLVTGATNNGREDGARCVIPGEPGFHQAGAVITHQGGSLFVVTHYVSSVTHTAVRSHTHTVALLDALTESSVCLL